MYCRNCGAKLRDDSKFCSVCGERIEAPKANNIGDTQEIMMSKSEFMKQKYEDEDYEYEDDNYENVKAKDYYKAQDNTDSNSIRKYGKMGVLIVCAIAVGIGIALLIVKFSSNSPKTSNITESVDVQKETNNDTESRKEVNQDNISKEDSATTSSKNSKSEDNKEVENQDKDINTNSNINNNNPNNIPLNGQINYVSDSLKGGNVKFAYPSFFNISNRADNYIDLQTNNSDALITVSINNNLPSNSRSAKDKYNSTIDKLKIENAEIGYSNLSKHESVVTWKKDGISYYQCDRYDANGTKSDSFIVSYPNAQEHYYYDIIQYIYDNFNTSADLK